jgi:hypothetical protein
MGEVARGNEEAALIELIRETLLELKHPVTREAIVQKVYTAREAFGPDHHPDVPDIMVVFRDDLGVLDACWSERVGVIKRTVYQHWLPRTGDHTPHSTDRRRHSNRCTGYGGNCSTSPPTGALPWQFKACRAKPRSAR